MGAEAPVVAEASVTQDDTVEAGITATGTGVQYVAGDKGFSSRKLVYGMATSVAIVAGGVLAAFVPAFVPVYPIYIGGLTGVLALYTGGNIAQRHVVGRHVVQMAKAPPGVQAPALPPVEPLPYEG